MQWDPNHMQRDQNYDSEFSSSQSHRYTHTDSWMYISEPFSEDHQIVNWSLEQNEQKYAMFRVQFFKSKHGSNIIIVTEMYICTAHRHVCIDASGHFNASFFLSWSLEKNENNVQWDQSYDSALNSSNSKTDLTLQ